MLLKKRKEADHKILNTPIKYRRFKIDYSPFYPLFTIPLCQRFLSNKKGARKERHINRL